MKRLLRHIANRFNQLTGRTPAVPTGRPGAAPRPRPPAAEPVPGKLGTAVKPGTARPGTAKPGPAGGKSGSTGTKPGKSAGRSLVYAPQPDGQADPGEIVWTWVAYEDDPAQGKDRPVLVVGRDGAVLQGLMLSSNSERDGQRHWFALGEGNWDRDHRPSWVRLDRVLTVAEAGIRREGSVLDRRRFDAVAKELRQQYGWR